MKSTNYKKIVVRSYSKKDLHTPTNNNSNVLVRSNSISRLFSQNKTIMHYLGQRLQGNDHIQLDNFSTLPYSPSHQEQYSKFSFNHYTKTAKISSKQFYRPPLNISNKKNGFLESKTTSSNRIKKEASIEEVNSLKKQNTQLKKEISSYKAILQQISDKNKRSVANGINSLSSYDNMDD